MLLAIDAGNTNVVFAVHDGNEWRGRWRIGRDRSPSSAASLSTSTKLAKADKVKRRASTKPTRRRRESWGAGPSRMTQM